MSNQFQTPAAKHGSVAILSATATSVADQLQGRASVTLQNLDAANDVYVLFGGATTDTPPTAAAVKAGGIKLVAAGGTATFSVGLAGAPNTAGVAPACWAMSDPGDTTTSLRVVESV